MGAACGCCGDGDDSKTEPLLSKEEGYTEMAPLKLTKPNKKLIGMMRAVLGALLPELTRLFPDVSEQDNCRELIIVMDRAIAQFDPSLQLNERYELMNRAVPSGQYFTFRSTLQARLSEVQEQEANPSPHRGRRPSASSLSRMSTETRTILPRLLTLWFEADTDCSGTLEESEVKSLLHQMNIDMSSKGLEKLIKDHDVSHTGALSFFEFMTLYEKLTTVNELIPVFRLYAKGGVEAGSATPMKTHDDGVIVMDDLRRFISTQQKQKPEEVESIARQFGSMKVHAGLLGITYRQFQNALFDQAINSWMNPKEQMVNQDMKQPLTHYYIDCSHNTYASGHQLTGEASCDMYRRCLLNGCRCVELDCWDGPDGDPLVTHGHTLMSKIRFYDTCVAINETAFRNSPFPVILSLEIHTSLQQQETMVQMMKEIFGSKLTNAAMAEASSLHGFEYTPEGLKFKVLIKAKRLKGKSSETLKEEDVDVDTNPAMPPTADGSQPTPAPPKKDTHALVSQALSDATFSSGMKFSTMEEMLKKPHYGVASVEETTVEKWAKNPQQYRELSKQFLLRVYPKGIRMDSSNFNPQPAWNIGAQMTAMNIQTLDEPMRLHRCRYMVNGRCGYVLKPHWMRAPGLTRPTGTTVHILTVKVICGCQLPKPHNSKSGEVIDPYVEVFITGLDEDDTSSKPRATKVVDDNGFNPVWNETFTFSVHCVELAMLTIRVMEKDPLSSEFIGDNSIPVECLREGIRAVPLFVDGDIPHPSPTCVLCQFSWQMKTDEFVVVHEDLRQEVLKKQQEPAAAAPTQAAAQSEPTPPQKQEQAKQPEAQPQDPPKSPPQQQSLEPSPQAAPPPPAAAATAPIDPFYDLPPAQKQQQEQPPAAPAHAAADDDQADLNML